MPTRFPPSTAGDRFSLFGACAYAIAMTAIFSHVGTFFYSGTAVRLFVPAVIPYVVALGVGLFAPGPTARAIWINVLGALMVYSIALFVLPPDGQKTFIFPVVALCQVGTIPAAIAYEKRKSHRDRAESR